MFNKIRDFFNNVDTETVVNYTFAWTAVVIMLLFTFMYQ